MLGKNKAAEDAMKYLEETLEIVEILEREASTYSLYLLLRTEPKTRENAGLCRCPGKITPSKKSSKCRDPEWGHTQPIHGTPRRVVLLEGKQGEVRGKSREDPVGPWRLRPWRSWPFYFK